MHNIRGSYLRSGDWSLVRVTNALRRDQAISEIQANLSRLAELNRQLATGKRFTRVAQDPLAGAQVMRIQRDLRSVEQYRKNGTAAQVRLGAEEAVVEQVDELLRQARDFALSFAKGDPPYTPQQAAQRQLAADQLTTLLEEAVALGNTRIGTEYILAGANSTTEPFDTTAGAGYGTYQGGTVARTVEIADGVLVAPNHTGDQFIGPAIVALRDLRDAVDPANGQTEAQAQLQVQVVFNASESLRVSQAETGVTGARMAATIDHGATRTTDLRNLQGSLQEVNPEEVVSRLLSLQTTVEASYAATSRLLSLTLADYLG
jgi:flagellar hook-associated protein 3 FlgL